MASSVPPLPEALNALSKSLKGLRSELAHLSELRQKRWESRQALVVRLASRIDAPASVIGSCEDSASANEVSKELSSDGVAGADERKRPIGIAGVGAVASFESPLGKTTHKDPVPEELGTEETLKEMVLEYVLKNSDDPGMPSIRPEAVRSVWVEHCTAEEARVAVLYTTSLMDSDYRQFRLVRQNATDWAVDQMLAPDERGDDDREVSFKSPTATSARSLRTPPKVSIPEEEEEVGIAASMPTPRTPAPTPQRRMPPPPLRDGPELDLEAEDAEATVHARDEKVDVAVVDSLVQSVRHALTVTGAAQDPRALFQSYASTQSAGVTEVNGILQEQFLNFIGIYSGRSPAATSSSGAERLFLALAVRDSAGMKPTVLYETFCEQFCPAEAADVIADLASRRSALWQDLHAAAADGASALVESRLLQETDFQEILLSLLSSPPDAAAAKALWLHLVGGADSIVTTPTLASEALLKALEAEI